MSGSQFRIPNDASVRPIQPRQPRAVPGRRDAHVPFARVLDEKLQQSSLKFSAHAERRLKARNIQFTPEQLELLENAVEKARAKGGRETLILLDDVALVVSVANRTVITAIDGDSLKENVFTQIDSAVIT